MKDKCIEVEKGTTLLELFSCNMDTEEPLVVAAKVNSRMRTDISLMEDCRVEPVDLSMKDGERIYSRSLVLVFLGHAENCFPIAR